MRRIGVAVLVAAALGVGGEAAGQATPEEAVARYQETLRTGDFAANAQLMDPEALAELKESLARVAAFAGAAESAEFRETFGVESAAELAALEPAALYERMLRATLGGEEARELLRSMEVRTLGHVTEGEDVAHVVYRMRMAMGGMEMEQVQVAPVRRTPEGWRVMLTGPLAGIMQGLGAPPGR